MITLLMIPFFLVIRLSMDDNASFYGPEYTYNAQVSINNVNEHTSVKLKAFDMSSTLKCRPRAPDTLNCRFDNTGMRFYQQGLVSLGENFIKVWDMTEEPFEVIFDRNGVSELVVTKSMPPWVIGGLRAIVNQLNFGFYVKRKHDGAFVVLEKSYIGECETLVQITRRSLQDDEVFSDDIFEIAPMPGLKKTSREMIEIEKKRYLEECAEKVDYFFDSRDTLAKMTSSNSHILIADTNFTSYTDNEVTVLNIISGKYVKLHEKITLKLVSIVPNSNEYQPIDRSSASTFFTRKHADPSDEEQQIEV